MPRKINRTACRLAWLFPLFLAVIILSAGIFLINSRIFDIKKVSCEMDQYPCPLIYEPILVSLHQQNLLKLSNLTVTNQFQTLDPGIASITLRRTLPDKIKLTLNRRVALAKLELTDNLDFSGLTSSASATISGTFSGRIFFLDQKGEVFSGASEINNQLPVVKVPADKIITPGSSAFSQIIFKLITALNEYFVSATQIIWLPPALSVIQVTAGPYAVINLEKEISASIGSLQYILSGFKIDEALPVKIDLRFDKPVLSY